MKNLYEEYASELLHNYYNYYCTVYFGFIVEAVKESCNDGSRWSTLKGLHKHIKENYI